MLTQPSPERLIFDNKQYILSQVANAQQKVLSMGVHRAFNTEAYTLTQSVKERALESLKVAEKGFFCDLFANQLNAQEPLYCTRSNSAFRYNWTKLSANGQQILWANPPFTQLDRVLTKIVQNPCKIVLVTPNWLGKPGRRLLYKIAISQFFVPPG